MCGCVPKMNKFQQVSSDGHQISVVKVAKGKVGILGPTSGGGGCTIWSIP